MSLTLLDRISSLRTVFTDALSATGIGSLPVGGTTQPGLAGSGIEFVDPNINMRGFIHMAYDPVYDLYIMSNGEGWPENILYPPGHLGAFYPTILTHTLIDAGSLALAAGGLTTPGLAAWWYPISGAVAGFSYDHNMGILYAANVEYYAEQPRTSERYVYDFGNVMLVDGVYGNSPAAGGYFQKTGMNGEAAIDAATAALTYKYGNAYLVGRPIPIKGNLYEIMVPPVRFDDVVVFAFGTPGTNGYLSVTRPDANHTWLASRPIDLAFVYALMPISIDKFMLIGQTGLNAPLVSVTYRWSRGTAQLDIDSVTQVPTSYTYTWPTHMGFMAYDTTRQTLTLVSPDATEFERHVQSTLCHPGRPTDLSPPVPLGPVHAGRQTTFATLARSDLDPVPSPQTLMVYSGTSAGDFTMQPTEFRTNATQGVGQFTVGWASAACGTAVTLTTQLSSFSVAVSATTANGTAYGVEAMALLSTSAVFTVSATLSAAATTTVLSADAIILAKLPVQTGNAGGGTPWELNHPLSGAVATPLVFEYNPVQFTNLADQILTRPLYASTRTLEKTATVQYPGDATDVEVKLVWLGGGSRVAMSLAFFADLYAHFANPPAYANGQFLELAPKSLNNSTFQVIFTDLSVGGQDGISLDTLYAQGNGWIHETVEATFRVVGTL